jgi:predicted nuclease of predicted toxin-antitoxin system
VRILVDENIPRMTVRRLRELGHDVKDIRGTAGQGLGDSGLWSIAITEGRLLITTDKGFTEHRGTSHHGILIVRLRQPNRLRIHKSVMFAIERFQEAAWPKLLVVMRDSTMSTSRAGGPVERWNEP